MGNSNMVDTYLRMLVDACGNAKFETHKSVFCLSFSNISTISWNKSGSNRKAEQAKTLAFCILGDSPPIDSYTRCFQNI